jgi:hypothetical protein
MRSDWNFHYRNQGDFGRVLVGPEVPRSEMGEFRRFLDTLGYPWVDETRNPRVPVVPRLGGQALREISRRACYGALSGHRHRSRLEREREDLVDRRHRMKLHAVTNVGGNLLEVGHVGLW